MNDIDEQRIKQRAHDIWEAEGRPHGRDQDHWLQAVAELAEARIRPLTLTPPPFDQDADGHTPDVAENARPSVLTVASEMLLGTPRTRRSDSA